MHWYVGKNLRSALRKHVMRVDLRIYGGDLEDFNNPNDLSSNLKSILSSAIIKGLDLVGIVSHSGPQPGWQAADLVKQNKLDLWVCPGEEYLTADKVTLFIYFIKEAMPPNLPFEKAIAYAHSQKGFVMAAGLSKRQAQKVNRLKGSPSAPDAVEVYNASSGGYQHLHLDPDFPRFVSSAAKSAHELETLNVYTLVDRKELEGMGLVPEGEGADYTPRYLENDEAIQQGASESDVAEGNAGTNPGSGTPAATPNPAAASPAMGARS